MPSRIVPSPGSAAADKSVAALATARKQLSAFVFGDRDAAARLSDGAAHALLSDGAAQALLRSAAALAHSCAATGALYNSHASRSLLAQFARCEVAAALLSQLRTAAETVVTFSAACPGTHQARDELERRGAHGESRPVLVADPGVNVLLYFGHVDIDTVRLGARDAERWSNRNPLKAAALPPGYRSGKLPARTLAQMRGTTNLRRADALLTATPSTPPHELLHAVAAHRIRQGPEFKAAARTTDPGALEHIALLQMALAEDESEYQRAMMPARAIARRASQRGLVTAIASCLRIVPNPPRGEPRNDETARKLGPLLFVGSGVKVSSVFKLKTASGVVRGSLREVLRCIVQEFNGVVFIVDEAMSSQVRTASCSSGSVLPVRYLLDT
jgi:hypothetical protein